MNLENWKRGSGNVNTLSLHVFTRYSTTTHDSPAYFNFPEVFVFVEEKKNIFNNCCDFVSRCVMIWSINGGSATHKILHVASS